MTNSALVCGVMGGGGIAGPRDKHTETGGPVCRLAQLAEWTMGTKKLKLCTIGKKIFCNRPTGSAVQFFLLPLPSKIHLQIHPAHSTEKGPVVDEISRTLLWRIGSQEKNGKCTPSNRRSIWKFKKTGRDPFSGLALSLSVNKSPIHLARQSL